MPRAIEKYILPYPKIHTPDPQHSSIECPPDPFVVRMTGQAPTILDTQMQKGELVLWAAVFKGDRNVDHLFQVGPTRMELPDTWLHLGTFQLMGGRLVIHAFYLGLYEGPGILQ